MYSLTVLLLLRQTVKTTNETIYADKEVQYPQKNKYCYIRSLDMYYRAGQLFATSLNYRTDKKRVNLKSLKQFLGEIWSIYSNCYNSVYKEV